MSTSFAVRAPISTLDPYADHTVLNPWPLYCDLRETGPAVWLKKYWMCPHPLRRRRESTPGLGGVSIIVWRHDDDQFLKPDTYSNLIVAYLG
jgi:hypothetical protein